MGSESYMTKRCLRDKVRIKQFWQIKWVADGPKSNDWLDW